jgi:hypothetical protein
VFWYNEESWLPAIRIRDELQGRSENVLNINLSKTPQKCGTLGVSLNKFNQQEKID